ncbi:MAG: hypothetical protein ACRDO1_13295 [Nocardioidaceae bacterium]
MRQRRQFPLRAKIVGIALLVAALPGAARAGAPAADPVSTGGPPKDLIIQLSSWSFGPAALTDWMNYICANRRNPAQPGYVRSIVLQDIATPDPTASVEENPPTADDQLLTPLIDALLPYFPGGTGPCQLDNVFVGTIDLAPYRANPYSDGIKDENYRWNNILRSRTLADEFKAHVAASGNPGVVYHWYVTYEAMLNYFDDPGIQQGYLAYLLELTRQLAEVRDDSAMLWSPGVDAAPPPGGIGGTLGTNLASFFAQYKSQAAAYNSYGAGSGGPLWLDLQDHVGSMDCGAGHHMTKEDAAAWLDGLRGLFSFTSLRMNVEQFRHLDPGSCTSALVAADPAEVMARESYYNTNGILLGAAWELRFWGANNHL